MAARWRKRALNPYTVAVAELAKVMVFARGYMVGTMADPRLDGGEQLKQLAMRAMHEVHPAGGWIVKVRFVRGRRGGGAMETAFVPLGLAPGLEGRFPFPDWWTYVPRAPRALGAGQPVLDSPERDRHYPPADTSGIF